MEIIGIFVDEITFDGLYSIIHEAEPGVNSDEDNEIENQSEFDKLFIQWTDVEYVSNYLLNNKTFWETPYFKGVVMDDLISTIISEANSLDELIYTYATDNEYTLQMLFKPLYNSETRLPVLQETKAKNQNRKSLLRVYALRLGENTFIVTGGAIKLTHLMEEHPDTIKELEKIDEAKKFLARNNIQYLEDLKLYYEPE